MCYIFSCFGWALDFLQRIVTFILACILSCFITLGIVVAIAAGIAYGYNYSMAEFLTFTRHDTTVYMRRGHFYDKPDFDTDKDVAHARRSGGGASDAQNDSMEIPDEDSGNDQILRKGPPNPWGHLKDTRQYAEMLTKYSRKPLIDEPLYADDDKLYETPAPAPLPNEEITEEQVTLVPSPREMPTTLIDRGSPRVVMRKFMPVSNLQSTRVTHFDITNPAEESDRYNAHNGLYSDEGREWSTKFFELNGYRPTLSPLQPKNDQKTEKLQKKAPLRHFRPEKDMHKRTEAYLDYREENVDEENVVYKPV